MTDNRMILDDPFFKAIWASSIPVPDIAKIYGTSRAAIYRAVRRFGMEARNLPDVEPEQVWPADPPEDLNGALIWSRGKWALLNRVADAHNLTSAQVQAAYHKAR